MILIEGEDKGTSRSFPTMALSNAFYPFSEQDSIVMWSDSYVFHHPYNMEKLAPGADSRRTDREMSFAAREEMRLAAAKRKASEIIYRAAANRSAGRLTDIGEYQTGLHYDAISKFLANFHERPSLLVPQIQRNLRALLKIEMERAVLECEFQKDLQLLRMESLQPDLDRLAERRKQIVDGDALTEENSPTEQCERKWNIHAGVLVDYLRGIKGIPYFWRGVFNSTSFLSEFCSEQDWLVLAYLRDIRSKPLLTGGFKLEFRFATNPFAVDDILSKTFEGSYKFDRDRPYKFGGWSIDFISGRDIRWREGMDPTITRTSDTSKSTPGEDTPELILIKTKSFFHFFAKPEIGSEIGLLNAETQYAVGSYIYRKVIPYAVLLLVGETEVTSTPSNS